MRLVLARLTAPVIALVQIEINEYNRSKQYTL